MILNFNRYNEITPAELLKECAINITKGSGPGGQNRNKRETAVTLIHMPSGISVYCCDQRSLEQNKQIALRNLKVEILKQIKAERQKLKTLVWKNKRKINKHKITDKAIKEQQSRKLVKKYRRRGDLDND